MQAHINFSANLRHFLEAFSLPEPAPAPDEIYGAGELGCQPGDDYLYLGCRYVRDLTRDVLVREDLQLGNAWRKI